MGRAYSKDGCITCRRRRKKCGEEKPVCLACTRLCLFCTYDPGRWASDKRFKRKLAWLRASSHSPVRSISTVSFRSDVEAAVLRSAPSSAVAFFSPVCRDDTLDLSILWQMTLQDDVLRKAVVAAFSRIRGSGELGVLDRQAYGQALTLVREGVRGRELTKTESIYLQPAILWLGWAESVGIGALTSICHWESLCILASQAKKSGFWRRIPPSLYVLVLEATLIHYSLHAMFTAKLRPAWKTWQKSRLMEILDDVNPPGPGRVAKSPIASGQYLIYSIILEVSVLLRYRDERCRAGVGRIVEMERAIRRTIDTIGDDFIASLSWGCSLERVATACQAFRLASNSALLCIITLTETPDDRVHEFDFLASKSLEMLLSTPLTLMTYGTTSWAVAVLACAIRSQSDFDRLFSHWTATNGRLDSGHLGHMNLLFSKLTALRATWAEENSVTHEEEEEVDKQLPVGLSLLRQEHGVLLGHPP